MFGGPEWTGTAGARPEPVGVQPKVGKAAKATRGLSARPGDRASSDQAGAGPKGDTYLQTQPPWIASLSLVSRSPHLYPHLLAAGPVKAFLP